MFHAAKPLATSELGIANEHMPPVQSLGRFYRKEHVISRQATYDQMMSKVGMAEVILDHVFTDKELILSALTHPSAIDDGHVETTYERLEFLGDSIVGAVVATEIFERFPQMDEGGMTRIKVSLVSGTSLASVADSLGVGEAIIFGGSETGTGRRGLHSALENVYEALTAALFLDAGLLKARAWVLRTLGPHIAEEIALEPENPKSSLQEILQIDRITPTYRIIATDGPPHDRVFTSEVLADGEVLGVGVGRSKKDAEAAAADDALRVLDPKRSER